MDESSCFHQRRSFWRSAGDGDGREVGRRRQTGSSEEQSSWLWTLSVIHNQGKTCLSIQLVHLLLLPFLFFLCWGFLFLQLYYSTSSSIFFKKKKRKPSFSPPIKLCPSLTYYDIFVCLSICLPPSLCDSKSISQAALLRLCWSLGLCPDWTHATIRDANGGAATGSHDVCVCLYPVCMCGWVGERERGLGKKGGRERWEKKRRRRRRRGTVSGCKPLHQWGFFFFFFKRGPSRRRWRVFFLSSCGGEEEVVEEEVEEEVKLAAQTFGWRDDRQLHKIESLIDAIVHTQAPTNTRHKWDISMYTCSAALHLTETEAEYGSTAEVIERGLLWKQGKRLLTVGAVPWERQTCIH